MRVLKRYIYLFFCCCDIANRVNLSFQTVDGCVNLNIVNLDSTEKNEFVFYSVSVSQSVCITLIICRPIMSCTDS